MWKNFKKFIAGILMLVMVIALVACGERNQGESSVQEETLPTSNDSTNVETEPQEKIIDVNQDVIPDFVKVASDAVSEVKDAVCFKVGSPYALVFHEQQMIDETNENATPVVVEESVLVPVEFISDAFGIEIEVGNEKATVKEGSNTIELIVGSNVIQKNGADVTLLVPVQICAETMMIPLDGVEVILGKKVFYEEDMELIVISDDQIEFTRENDLDKMVDIAQGFVFERPSREQIASDIKETAPEHPRVLANASDFERIRNLIDTDETFKSWVDSLMLVADKYVAGANDGEPKPVFALDDAGRLASYYSIEDRATSLGMAWQITGDKKYVDAMWYMLEDLCDETKWAHWNPGHFLCAAEMMSGVAIAYDWMYDAWTDEQRTAIEEALYRNAIEVGITAYYGATDYITPGYNLKAYSRGGWFKDVNNWNQVCSSGVIQAGAAMATHEKYGDLAVKLMNFAINAFEVATRWYAPDGAYREGVSYWEYGTGNLILALSTLEAATGSTYGIPDAPGFNKTYSETLYNESKQGSFNYHDGNFPAGRTNTGYLFWFGKENNAAELNSIRYNELVRKEKNSSFMDILWYDPSNIVTDVGNDLELDYHFYMTKVATMRSSWTDDYQLFVGLHADKPGTTHGHLDAGTFVLDALGTRWFVDLGSASYFLPGYWEMDEGGRRWQYYDVRAEGQNTIVINPDSEEDQYVYANPEITEFASKSRGAYAKADLTEVYKTDVSKATRGVMLGSNRREIIIQDEITMLKPSEYYWFGHTEADIEISVDGRSAILTKQAKKLYAEIISDDADLKFSVMDAVSLPTSPVPDTGGVAQISREGIRKLVVYGSGVEEINMAIVFKPFTGEDIPQCEYTYTSLDDWSIPDGDLVVPKLENISVAGETVKGFDKNVTGYEVVLPTGTENVPQVTAVSDSKSSYEITLPEQLPGTATIKVVDKDDASIYSTYSLFMRVAAELELEVSGAETTNVGENCLDKDLSTRWAVEGESWGIFRFGNPRTISSVWIAAWKSAERQLIFDIEVSEDGENFTQVWSGKTTAKEDVLDEFKIPEGTYRAVKLVLHGTTTGNWNSLLEVEFK